MHVVTRIPSLLCPRPLGGSIKRWCCLDLMSDVWRPSVAYVAPKSRTERRRETKIGTEVVHVTRTPLSRSKCQDHVGRGHIVAASRTACYRRFRCCVYSTVLRLLFITVHIRHGAAARHCIYSMLLCLLKTVNGSCMKPVSVIIVGINCTTSRKNRKRDFLCYTV